MATHSQRFAVGDPAGRRSSEWLVAWKAKTSDVYLATRTLGEKLKASIHESGRCHVRSPGPGFWRSPGAPPRFLEEWTIDPAAQVAQPFGIIIPEPELRAGPWKQHRDRGTVWIPARTGYSTEIAVFLLRPQQDPIPALVAAGWAGSIVDETLPDGRRLLVVIGWSTAHIAGQADIERFREQAAPLLSAADPALQNPRCVLVAADVRGTRRFVEVATSPEEPLQQQSPERGAIPTRPDET